MSSSTSQTTPINLQVQNLTVTSGATASSAVFNTSSNLDNLSVNFNNSNCNNVSVAQSVTINSTPYISQSAPYNGGSFSIKKNLFTVTDLECNNLPSNSLNINGILNLNNNPIYGIDTLYGSVLKPNDPISYSFMEAAVNSVARPTTLLTFDATTLPSYIDASTMMQSTPGNTQSPFLEVQNVIFVGHQDTNNTVVIGFENSQASYFNPNVPYYISNVSNVPMYLKFPIQLVSNPSGTVYLSLAPGVYREFIYTGNIYFTDGNVPI